jgi:cell division protein FtsQ
MRRPPPIEPPRRPETGAPTPADTIEADQPFVASFPRSPRRGRAAPAASVTDESIAASDEPATPEGSAPTEPVVGLRDVWRAAHARRRVLQAEARRFTAAQRRRRRIWIGVAAAFVLLVGGSVAAAYSPLFAVQTIDVVGTHALKASDVQRALSRQLGRPYPLVDQSEIKAALVRFPMVETYTLEAVPPHELVVRIVERTPVGFIKSAAGYTVVDAAGVALSTTPTQPAGEAQITVSGGLDSASFQAIGEVMRALPASIRDKVTAVSAQSPDAVSFVLGPTATKVVWGSADDTAFKVVTLERTMKARPPAGVHQYDVSAPHAVVVR